jgi:hypothetical protein
MTAPAFWATPFSYTALTGVTDVNAIIAGIHTALTALAWTDASGVGTGPWTSPVRADGISWSITMARTSATRITWTMKDQAGLAVNTAAILQDIDATGTPVQIYAGPLHLCVNTARATNETAWFAVLDQAPNLMHVPRAQYVCFNGPRSSAGTYTSYAWEHFYSMAPGATTYSAKNGYGMIRVPATSSNHRITVAGTLVPVPAEYGDASSMLFWGRIPQAIAVCSTGLSVGSEVTVPIDTGVNAVFKVINNAVNAIQFLAFRKS